VLTTANAAEPNGLRCLPKHGGARDSKFLVTHPMTDECSLASAITRRARPPRGHRAPQMLYNASQNLVIERTVIMDGRCCVVVGILAYYARGGFDSRTVQTFVCMNMSVCIESGICLHLGVSMYNMYVFTKKIYISMYLSVI
jgi:hypothetical protein